MLKDHLSKKLPKFKIPERFYPWPESYDGSLKPAKKDFEKLLGSYTDL